MPKVTKDKEAMQKRGDILLNLRKKRNIKQSTVADILGISQQAYLKYEHGDADPTIDALIKLSQFYNVSIEYLLGLEPLKNPLDALSLSKADKFIVQTYINLPPEDRTSLVEIIKKIAAGADIQITTDTEKVKIQQETPQRPDIKISQNSKPFVKIARNGKRTILSDEEVEKLHALDDDEPPNLN